MYGVEAYVCTDMNSLGCQIIQAQYLTHVHMLQLVPPEATQSPERRMKMERERSVIARISAAEPGAQEVGPRAHSGPLSLGLSLGNPNLPPLRPIDGGYPPCAWRSFALF